MPKTAKGKGSNQKPDSLPGKIRSFLAANGPSHLDIISAAVGAFVSAPTAAQFYETSVRYDRKRKVQPRPRKSNIKDKIAIGRRRKVISSLSCLILQGCVKRVGPSMYAIMDRKK